jgi:hypothetical protein
MGDVPEPFSSPPPPRFRGQARIYDPFPVTIRSVDASGKAFEYHTVLDHFSATGFHVQLRCPLTVGTKLFAVVHLSTASRAALAPRIAVSGVVLRVDPQADGRWGVAVRFRRYRFL